MASTHSKVNGAKSAKVDIIETHMTPAETRQWESLFKATGSAPDVVPAGWHTAEELSKTLDRSISYVYRLLSQLRATNKVECKRFVRYVNARVYPVMHYHLLA